LGQRIQEGSEILRSEAVLAAKDRRAGWLLSRFAGKREEVSLTFLPLILPQTARKPNFVLDDHSSRSAITDRLQQPTRKFRHCTLPLGASGRCASIARKKAIELPAYLVLLRVGFTMRFELPQTRCALTAPFHPYPIRSCEIKRAVYSLLHWPSRCLHKHPSRTLSGTLPCGVRTFLPRQTFLRTKPAAIIQPPAASSLAHGTESGPIAYPNLKSTGKIGVGRTTWN